MAHDKDKPELVILCSPDLDAYAAGELPIGQVRCVLCTHAPCTCPKFGTPEYFALLDRVHGRNQPGGEAQS